MNSLLALGARALTMVVSLVCGVITTRMILGETDIQHYALYSLLITIPSLLTFTDLGSGAVLVNAVATSDDIRTDRRLRLQVTSVGRILLMFATGLMLINTVLLVTGGWRALFGDAGAIPGRRSPPSCASPCSACRSPWACGSASCSGSGATTW